MKLSPVGKENSAVPIGCNKSLVDHIHDLILAGINIDEFFGSYQEVAAGRTLCVRNADDHRDLEYNYIKKQNCGAGLTNGGEQETITKPTISPSLFFTA